MFKTLTPRIFLVICLSLLHSWLAQADVVLWSQASTDYDILVGSESSPSEHTAAEELASYLRQVSGVEFKVRYISSQSDLTTAADALGQPSSHICVGHFAGSLLWDGCRRYAPDDEGFEIVEFQRHLIINGGQLRGTLYGVYTLLEQQVGVHWYTPDYTQIPHRATCKVKATGKVSPAIRYRLDYAYDAIRDDVWCARNLLNMQTNPRTNKYGGMEGYWGIHTFQKLLPAEKYFETHPEYFSLHNGHRIDNGQLCLSNPNVLRIVTEHLLQYIKESPDCWGYDVSQNDNTRYCECRRCTAIANRYGGQSGLMVWFVNQVAERIGRVFPDVSLGTFAYQYTRQPPRGIRPANNVVIRLCDIECCHIHGLEKCEVNLRFDRDLKQWRKLTDKIFVWDYLTGFCTYQTPYPVFRHLGTNIAYFGRHQVIGILEQGAHDAPWAEFSELKQWIIAKLLWQPEQDVDSLAHVFIHDYYGAAAESVWLYYRMVESLGDTDTHAACHFTPSENLYTPHFRQESMKLLQQAEAFAVSSGDDVVVRRVRRVLCQAYTLRVVFDQPVSLSDGTLSKLKSIIAADPTIMAEFGMSLNQYLRRFKNI